MIAKGRCLAGCFRAYDDPESLEPRIRDRNNPPLREGLLIGKENGFRPVIDFFWHLNLEYSVNMLPHPFIKRSIQEARYARDEIDADGVEGYRLGRRAVF